MIFSIQRYLEDYFTRLGLSDLDQYAVKLANAYAKLRSTASDDDLVKAFRRIRTVFFRNNSNLNRVQFERNLIKLLRKHFQKKSLEMAFPGGVSIERKQINKKHRRTMATLLSKFREAIEARAIDVFWQSRKQSKLTRNPERIGQGLLATFIKGVLFPSQKGLVLREVHSGIGFIDIAVIFSSVLHLIELKVLTSKFVGVSQLEHYMRTEKRDEGWLVIFDARAPSSQSPITNTIVTKTGKIKVVLVNVNPIPPSQLSR
jgi:hypothetical protein